MDDQTKNTPPGPSNNDQPSATPPAKDINSPMPATTPPAPGSTTSPTDSTPATDLPKNPLPIQPQSSGGRRKYMMFGIVAVVVIAIAVAAVMVLNKPKKTVTPTAVVKKSVALLRVGVTQPFPTDFYPNIDNSVFSAELSSQIFEGLTQFQKENQIVPDLATGWTNPDNNTWVFKLKQGVKFHDGNTMTSAQVKASLEALEKTDYGQAYTSTIKSVDATDSSTVTITTSSPDPLLPNELANLWIYDTGSGKANDAANGTGPYTIKPGTTLSADSAQLVSYDGYHGGTPLVKELNFEHFTDADAVTKAIQANQLDIGDLSSLSAVNTVQSYGFTAYADKNPQVYFIMPNTAKANSPLAKLKVRQAIYETLDPNALMKADGRNGTVATQLVPQEIPGYDPSIKRPAIDATAAKSAITAAGYPNGFTLTLTYSSAHQTMAVEAQKELAPIGVTLTLDPETSGKTLGQKAFGGQTDLTYFAYSSSLLDTSDVAEPLVVDNTPNYTNDQINTVYKQASTTFDTAGRLKLLQQINQLAMNDVATFPLFTPEADYFAIKTNLVIRTDNLYSYSGIDFGNVYSK